MILKIKIQQGRVTIGADRLKQVIRSLSDGFWSIEVKKWKNKRSLDQNALYWKWLQVIGEDFVYHKDELHEEFIELFADIYTARDLNGKPKQKRMRTSKMNTKQMSRYMDRIQQFAAEQNIRLPQPEPELTT